MHERSRWREIGTRDRTSQAYRRSLKPSARRPLALEQAAQPTLIRPPLPSPLLDPPPALHHGMIRTTRRTSKAYCLGARDGRAEPAPRGGV